jgi:hypothetical protein
MANPNSDLFNEFFKSEGSQSSTTENNLFNDFFSSMKKDLPEQKPVQDANFLQKTFDVPSAAIRGALQGRGYSESAANFKDVPKFQDIALDKFYDTKFAKDHPYMAGAVGMVPSAAGYIADTLTNPVEAAITLAAPIAGKYAGKASSALFGGKSAGRKVAERSLKALEEVGKKFDAEYTGRLGDGFKQSFNLKNVARNPQAKKIADAFNEAIDIPELGRKGSQFSKIYDDLANVNTLGDLHDLKVSIGRAMSGSQKASDQRFALNRIYRSIDDVLKNQTFKQPNGEVFGDVYSDISKRFRNFKSTTENYVRSASSERVGGYVNPTGRKITNNGKDSVLNQENVKNAYKDLEKFFEKRPLFGKATGGQDLLREAKSARFKENLPENMKKLSGKALAAFFAWRAFQNLKDGIDRSSSGGNQNSN